MLRQNALHWWIWRKVDWIVGSVVTLGLDFVLCEFVSGWRWPSTVFDEISELKLLIFIVFFNWVEVQGSVNIELVIIDVHIIETIITSFIDLGRFGSSLWSIFSSDGNICDF